MQYSGFYLKSKREYSLIASCMQANQNIKSKKLCFSLMLSSEYLLTKEDALCSQIDHADSDLFLRNFRSRYLRIGKTSALEIFCDWVKKIAERVRTLCKLV